MEIIYESKVESNAGEVTRQEGKSDVERGQVSAVDQSSPTL